MTPTLASLLLSLVPQNQAAVVLERIPSSQYRWYGATALPLALDARHVAVLGADGGAPAPEVLAREGLSATPFAGVHLVELPPALRSETSIEALTRRLADGGGLFVSPVFVDDLGGPMYLNRDVIVGFEEGVTQTAAEGLIDLVGALEVLDRDWTGMRGVWRLRSTSLDGFDVLSAANALAETRGVRFAEPDWTSSAVREHVPADPRYPDAWALNNTGQTTTTPTGGGTPGVDMNAPEAWDMTKGSSVIVMVMDDGVQLDHPDLNISHGQDFTTSNGGGGPVNAWDTHGTAVAGCIAARMNGVDTVGLAPESTIAAAKIGTSTSPNGFQITDSSVINALWAAQLIGVRVSNSSWGMGVQSAAMDQKFTDTRNAGMVHFAASGNDNVGTVSYPAVIGPVHAVGAIDWNGARALFGGGCWNSGGGSNWGQELSWVAPGEDVLTTDRTGADGYNGTSVVCIDGTSFASPYAAAVAALILSRNPNLQAWDVETIMRDSARDLGVAGYDTTFGWGLVDAEKALLDTQPLYPVAYCTSGTSTNGCNATMSAFGVPSIAQSSGFVLTASGVEGMKTGLVFYSITGRHSAVWGPGSTSFLCVKAPTQRTGVQISGGTAGLCDGSLSVDLLAFFGAHPFALGQPLAAGTPMYAQAWFRDPPAPKTTNLSNAIEFTLWP